MESSQNIIELGATIASHGGMGTFGVQRSAFMANLLNKLKGYAVLVGTLLIGWFLLVFQLRGRKIARLEAKELVSDENDKQKELDKAVEEARKDYEDS